MPISADPNRTAVYALELRPEIQFVCRFMSLREHQIIDDMLIKASKADTELAAGNYLLGAIGIGVTGWTVDKPYSTTAVAELLTPDEVAELAVSYRFAVRAKESDLKKSRRESMSPTKAPASAATSQTPAK